MSISYGTKDTTFFCDGDNCDEVVYVAMGQGMPSGWVCGGPIKEIGSERHYCPECKDGQKTCEECK